MQRRDARNWFKSDNNDRDRQNAFAIALVTDLIRKRSEHVQNSLAFLEQDC